MGFKYSFWAGIWFGYCQCIEEELFNCVVKLALAEAKKMEGLRNLDIDAHCFDLDGEISGLDDAGKMALLSSSHVIGTILDLGY